jgi:hypothetical protein
MTSLSDNDGPLGVSRGGPVGLDRLFLSGMAHDALENLQ